MKMRVGQTIEIIYQDKTDKITQRKVEIIGIRADRVRTNYLTTGAPRVFLASGILSWRPLQEKRHA